MKTTSIWSASTMTMARHPNMPFDERSSLAPSTSFLISSLIYGTRISLRNHAKIKTIASTDTAIMVFWTFLFISSLPCIKIKRASIPDRDSFIYKSIVWRTFKYVNTMKAYPEDREVIYNGSCFPCPSVTFTFFHPTNPYPVFILLDIGRNVLLDVP